MATPTQLNEEERTAFRSAAILMLIISVAITIGSFAGISFFAIEFTTAIVYTPTVVLAIGWLYVSRRKKASEVIEPTVPRDV